LVNPQAGGSAHPQGNSCEVSIRGNCRHSIVQKLCSRPSLLIGQEHLPFGESLTGDVVYAPRVFVGIEREELIDMPCIGIWEQSGLPRDSSGLWKED
jgi:hypothetical protein